MSCYLVTGGTGSFGHRVAVELLKRGEEVRVFSRCEFKQSEMKKRFPGIGYVIGDVRDYDAVRAAMEGVDYVFHAAALKQVPNCERFPMETVKTNVLGSSNVFRAAREAGVEHVVALSTDKSTAPVNVLGATKMLMERLALSEALVSRRATQPPDYTVVRYGNVLGSRGSVVPVFQDQIAAGGPITVTDPTMTRFLLTLDDAVDLVFMALACGGNGSILVKKAPACTVGDLARACVLLYCGGQIEVRTVGTRPGERKHEILVTEQEMPCAVDSGGYYTIRPGVTVGSSRAGAYTSENTTRLSVEEVVELLKKAEKATGDEKEV